jgi:hypothetical protein
MAMETQEEILENDEEDCEDEGEVGLEEELISA